MNARVPAIVMLVAVSAAAEPTVQQLWKARALEALDKAKRIGKPQTIRQSYQLRIEMAYALHAHPDADGSLRKISDNNLVTYHLLMKAKSGDAFDAAYHYLGEAREPMALSVQTLPKNWMVLVTPDARPGEVLVNTEDAILQLSVAEPFVVDVIEKYLPSASQPEAKSPAIEGRTESGRACEKGDAAACRSLLPGLLTGKAAAPADADALINFLDRICQEKPGVECTWLGIIFIAGGVPRDRARALELFRRACSAKESSGCKNLGAMLSQ